MYLTGKKYVQKKNKKKNTLHILAGSKFLMVMNKPVRIQENYVCLSLKLFLQEGLYFILFQ
jgi:hypothetical protein